MAPNQPYQTRNYAVGESLLTLRNRVKLTQSELAARIGIHRRTVQKWESGETYPTVENLRALLATLLTLGAFTPGQEDTEAAELWQQVSEHAPQPLAFFDTVWFDQLLVTRGGNGLSNSALALTILPPANLRQEQGERNQVEPTGRDLPFQPTALIGRTAELKAIAKLLADPACRLLTLLGPGGIGKTRLGLEVAERQSALFTDGVVFVEFTAVSTPSQIVSAIGDALNLSFAGQQSSGHDPTAHLLAYLRKQHMLLILDGFEHLLAWTALVSALIEQAPRLTILITSQARLNLQAEWLFDVEGLTYPPAGPHKSIPSQNLTELADYSAVQLFVQRAAQVQPGFTLLASNLATIVRICQHVAGMPLALELAAVSIRILPVTQIERQIHTNLDVLATTLRDIPVRHRSLRAVFDYAWELLNEHERTLLSRLASFRGGFDRAAVEAICIHLANQDATIARTLLPTLLAALVDKSLVRQDHVESRLRLLEPIREYALAQLVATFGTATVQQAHATYYLTVAEAAAAQWDSKTGDAAIAKLDRERDNLRAALQWARDGGDLTIGLRIAGALRKFWRRRGAISEGRLWLEELLALDDSNADASFLTARLGALQAAAWLASDQHDYARAAQLFSESLALRRSLGEAEDDTPLLVNAALQARAVGQYQQATALLEDVLARQRALDDRGSFSSGGLGRTLFLLGMVSRERGDFGRATTHFMECDALHRALGDREGIALGLLGRSDMARDQGDGLQVRIYGEQSLASLRQLGLQWAIGFALNNLALAAYLDGDLTSAFALISEGVALFQAQKAEGSLAEVLITLGQIALAQGDALAAYSALTEALRLAWAVGPQLIVAVTLEALASVVLRLGESTPAMQAAAAVTPPLGANVDLAVRLLATAAALRVQMNTPVRPVDQPSLERTLATARALLGATAFAALWSNASQQPIEQILLALPNALSFPVHAAGLPVKAIQQIVDAPPLRALPASHGVGRIDWGMAQDVPVLYGRADELATLTQWVMAEQCRVITLVGMGGVGKTSLAVSFAHQIAPYFAAVVFRSLGEALPLPDLLDQLIHRVAAQPMIVPPQVADKLTLLIDLLRQARCLLILDNLETLMQSGATGGQYLAGYEAYGAFFQRLGETAHQSCLILTSREYPAELAPLEGPHAVVRSLRLAGLAEDACRMLLAEQELIGTPGDAAALARRYTGNPLALKLVIEPIRALFGGDIAAFLSEGYLIFEGVGQLLAQQISRASTLEQALLTWLAIMREPVALDELTGVTASAPPGIPRPVLLAALHSLWRRNLIERGHLNLTFTLHRVVLEYLTEQLIERAATEIMVGDFDMLLRHTLIQAAAKDYIRHSQERLIATPLLQRLTAVYGSTEAVDRQLLTLLDVWRAQPLTEQGYGPGNVVQLLRLLRGNLRGLNLARLALIEVYWQGVEAQDSSLAQALVRNNVFTEVFGIIHAVAATPSGSYWAVSSVNGALQVWRNEGRAIHLSIPAHTKQVKALAFSPDERILASGSWDCTIKLWDMTSGALLFTLEGHTDYVQDIAFAPDGRQLASGGDDRTVLIWDIATGACLKTIQAHTDNTYGVVWSPDGKWVASCGFDQRVCLWEVASGSCVQTFSGHSRPVSKLVFSPDMRLLASGGFDRTLRIWDVASGACIKLFAEHTSTIMAIAWSPDGQTLASCSYDGTIRLWELQRDTAQRILLGHGASINAIAFTAGGKLLLSGSDDQTVRVWDVASGWCVRVIEGYGLFCFGVVWSPDGRSLLSANSDTTLALWNVADGTVRLTLRGHTHTVYGVAWSPDGQRLASSGFDQTVRIWDATSGVCLRIIQAHTDSIYRVAWWSPDGRWLASAGRDQAVRLWDSSTGVSRWVGRGHSGPINEVVWSPDGQRLASCGEDRTVRLWRAQDGALLQTLTGHESSIAGLAWSPDGRWLASCGGGGTFGELFLWDAVRGEQVNSLVGHNSVVSRVAWSQDSQQLFSGGITGVIRWWDVQSGVNLHTQQGHQGWLRSLSASPDGTMLVSSGEDGVIHLWDVTRAELIRTLRIDRPYERMDIRGLTGITEAQRATLVALGALELNAATASQFIVR